MLSSTFLFNGGKRGKRRKGTENDYLTRASLTIAKNGEECSSFLPFLPILQLTIAKLAGTKRNKRELDNHRVLSEKRGRGVRLVNLGSKLSCSSRAKFRCWRFDLPRGQGSGIIGSTNLHAHLCGSWRARISGNGEIYNAARQIRLRYVLLTVLPRNLHIHICKWRGASVEPIDQPCISRQNGKYTSAYVVNRWSFSIFLEPLALIKSIV